MGSSAVKVPVGEIGNVLDLIGGYLTPNGPPVAMAVVAASPVASPAAHIGGACGVGNAPFHLR
jgi:hypothetical protein